MLEWIDACERSIRGTLFLDNLGIDLVTGSLSVGDLVEFGDGISHFRFDAAGHIPDGAERYSLAATSVISSAALYLRGPLSDLSCDELATITRFDDKVASFWFDVAWTGGFGDWASMQTVIDQLNTAGDYSSILQAGACFRTGVPVVWLTKKLGICGHTPAGEQSTEADVVRDRLGLLSQTQDNFLCRVDFAPTEIDPRQLRRPTAFDGGFNLVFRSNVVREGHGWALDLRTSAPTCVEAVHPSIPLTGRHKFEPLGRVSYLPPFSWAALAKSADVTRIDTARIAIQGGKIVVP